MQCGSRLIARQLRPWREAEHSGFLTRERVILQPGLRRQVQPGGGGRGSQVHGQLFPFAKRMAEGRRLEVKHLLKSVSFKEDAKEWDEEAVENLRHESNTPQVVWGT